MNKTICLLMSITFLLAACAPQAAPGSPGGQPASWFDAPLPGSNFTPPNPIVQLVSHHTDPGGIAQLEFSVNGEVFDTADVQSNDALITDTRDWTPPGPGEYTLRVRAKNKNGAWGNYAETSLIVAAGAPAACADKLNVDFEDPLQKAQMLPGQSFTKTWTVTNTGDCTWGRGYHLVFTGGPSPSEGGSSMSGALDTPLGSLVSVPVLPGGTVNIPLNQVAPMAEGEYVGAWNLVAPDGNKVAITYGGSDTMPSMYVDIVVKGTAPGFSDKSLDTYLVYTGDCSPNQVTFAIHAFHPDGIRTVTFFFHLTSPDGETTPWSDGQAMVPAGGDYYALTQTGDHLYSDSGFPQAVVSYQFVIEPVGGSSADFVRSDVFSDLALGVCGGGPAPSGPSPTPAPITTPHPCEPWPACWVPH